MFSIVLTIGLVRILNQTAGGRYDTGSILEVVIYTSLINLQALISLALFLGVLMTLNRYWRDSEMFVWFSAGGLSLLSWIRPVLKFSIPVLIVVALCSLALSPWSRDQIYAYRERFAQQEDVTKLSPGRFIESNNGEQVIFLGNVDQDKGTVESIFVVDVKDDGSQAVVASEKGHIETRINGDRYIVLSNGKRYETTKADASATIADFATYQIRFDSQPPKEKSTKRVEAMQLDELLKTKDEKAGSELFGRICWPLIALNLALLGIPLSYNNPRSIKYYGQTAAVLIFILYLNGLSIFQTWIIQGKLNIWQSLVCLNLPVALLTIFLFYRLMTLNVGHLDSALWNWLLRPLRKARERKQKAKEATR